VSSLAPEQNNSIGLLPIPTCTFTPVFSHADTLSLHDLLPIYDAEVTSSLAMTENFSKSSFYIPVEHYRHSPTQFGKFCIRYKKQLQAIGIICIVCILAGVFLLADPVDSGRINLLQAFNINDNLVQVNDPSSIALTAQQKAIIAKVTTDGYDSPVVHTYVGLPTAPASTITSPGSTINHFTYGQCTYWANERYHQLSGYWVAWLGNADQWRYGAASMGWIVSNVPQVHSIIVLQPGVQGAGGYGHVAVVEKVNSDGSSVVTSDMNWYANGGGWNRKTYVTFHPGPGVSFVWHP
jgi:surface antigen